MKQFLNKIKRAVRLLFSNPRVFLRQLKPYIFRAKSGRIKINGVNFNIDLELDPVMRRMYFKSYGIELTDLLKRFLKEGDVFVDIGANVGYISAFALGLVGKTGEVHSFEPVPQYFKLLRKIKEENPEYNLYVNNAALGENHGKSQITVTNKRNIGWNTMIPDFMNEDEIKENIEIDVLRLTDYFTERNIERINLIKIDTEGFEFPIMKGFKEYLQKMKTLPILVIEIAPWAYPKLKSTCGEFADFMSELGYVARTIDCVHSLEVGKLEQITDVVFMPKEDIK